MTSQDIPLVSILTPSFNQGRWIGDALRSVETQTYPRVEHVVADGGSTDATINVLQRHERPGLSWFSRPDRGQSHAINDAFRQSSGEIVGWLNSDDAYYSVEAVSTAVSIFKKSPDVMCVYGHAALVGPAGNLLQLLWAPPFSRRLLRRHNFIVQPTAFVRRSALKSVFVDEEFHYMMDRELWLRLAQSHEFERMNLIVAVDRHHAERKSYSRLDLAARDRAVLDERYALPQNRFDGVAMKVRKLIFRLLGVRLVRQASQLAVGWPVQRDQPWRLAMRQMIVPRSRMAAR